MTNLIRALDPEACGVIRTRFVRCGKPGCWCGMGIKHGPYYYLQYRKYKPGVGWVRAGRHVRESELPELRQKLAEARQFTKSAINARLDELKCTMNYMFSLQEEVIAE